MTPATLRALANLVESGTPADYIGVGDAVTIIANPISAARWMERCPNGLLPGTSTPVAVQTIPVIGVSS